VEQPKRTMKFVLLGLLIWCLTSHEGPYPYLSVGQLWAVIYDRL